MACSRTMLCIYSAILCAVAGGCIRLVGTVYERAPDPRAADFVKVVSVSGTTLELADGSQYRILGIRAGESGKVDERLSRELRAMLVNTSGVLLETHDGIARVIVSGGYTLPQHPGIVLFPTVKERPPDRVDVALFLLQEGYARVHAPEISDELLRKEYEAAEVHAKRFRQGIWSE